MATTRSSARIAAAQAQRERVRKLWDENRERMSVAVRDNALKHGAWSALSRNERRAVAALLDAASQLSTLTLTAIALHN